MNICIFCSASDVDERFQVDAVAMAEGIARAGHTLVWGGSDTGLMKVCADAAQARGGKIVGVSMEPLRAKARQGADEMIIAPALAERKALLLKRSDVMVALVGGIGTLDELLEILELKKHGLHTKPVIVVNTEGFYDGLQQQMVTMDRLDFLPVPLDELVQFVRSASEALDAIERAQVEGFAHTQFPAASDAAQEG